MADLLAKWKASLSKTSQSAFGRLTGVFTATEITPGVWDDLEALLIQADIGLPTTAAILAALRQEVRGRGLRRTSELLDLLGDVLRSCLDTPPSLMLENVPSVILIVGVNGSGKTTSVAKLGYHFTAEGRKVLLVAADTYRAAAVDQLQIWAQRMGLPLVTGQRGGDPGAVVYDAIRSAQAKRCDVVLVDTAGRLHTRYNLMEDLKKVHRVAGKALPGAPHAVWLVLDATSGQNAFQQALAFKEAVGVTGIILSKLDTSARGGMVFAIRAELGLPVLFVGLGEKAEHLQPFDPDAFVAGILAE